MSYAVAYDSRWKRDVGYGVPALCDEPGCNEKIDRGLGSVCCDSKPFGGDKGCGLFFCGSHLFQKCKARHWRYKPTPDSQEWINHKATHSSWQEWRDQQKAGESR